MHQQALIGLTSLKLSFTTLFLCDLFPLSHGFNCLCSRSVQTWHRSVTLDQLAMKTNPLSEMCSYRPSIHLLMSCVKAQVFTLELFWVILSVGLYPTLYLVDSDLLTWLLSLTANLLRHYGLVLASVGYWLNIDLQCSCSYWGTMPLAGEDIHCSCLPCCNTWSQQSFLYRVDYSSISLSQEVIVILIYFAWTPKRTSGNQNSV